MRTVVALAVALISTMPGAFAAEDVFDRVEDHYANSDGVKIHYVTLGEGPVVLFVHGFPDFWYSWRDQMDGLSDKFKCVAMDNRAYNLSDKPQGVENYMIKNLVADVDAVIKDLGVPSVTLVGHDWGGFIAWNYTFVHQDKVNKLVIMNLPHPRGFTRELANNEEQKKNSAYARRFQSPEAASSMTAEGLASMFMRQDKAVGEKYVAAFKQSDMEGMLNYYKANYPKEPYVEATDFPVVTCPVLEFHGLKDTALHHHGLNNTWEWLSSDFTLVTVPDAGHWVQQEAANLVTQSMRSWLLARQ